MSILNWAEEMGQDRKLEEYKRGLWRALRGKRGMDREILMSELERLNQYGREALKHSLDPDWPKSPTDV